MSTSPACEKKWAIMDGLLQTDRGMDTDLTSPNSRGYEPKLQTGVVFIFLSYFFTLYPWNSCFCAIARTGISYGSPRRKIGRLCGTHPCRLVNRARTGQLGRTIP